MFNRLVHISSNSSLLSNDYVPVPVIRDLYVEFYYYILTTALLNSDYCYLILLAWNWGRERNKVAQSQLGGKAKIQSQEVWFQSLHFQQVYIVLSSKYPN